MTTSPKNFATDDSETIQICKKEFGDSCIAMECPRAKLFVDGKAVSVENADIILEEHNRENDRYLSNIEYITEVILLSEYNAFLGTICSESRIVYILNGEKYEHILVLNYGEI